MALVVFTSICGILLAPNKIHPIIAITVIISITMGAGAAGCFNMWWEREIDLIMVRTCTRPLAKGIIDPDSALALSIILGLGSIILLKISSNLNASLLLAFCMFFYCVVYTIFLKPRTVQNIVIGGIAGALPPVIGWASTQSSLLHPLPWLLFFIIFLWTPPHFWALSIHYRQDFKNSPFPMLPIIKGIPYTQKQILAYIILLTPFIIAPYYFGYASQFYLAIAALAHLWFIKLGWNIYSQKGNNNHIKLFLYSILYLCVIFTAIVVDYWITLWIKI